MHNSNIQANQAGICNCNPDRSRTEPQDEQSSGKVSGEQRPFPRKGAGLGLLGRKVAKPQQYWFSLAFSNPSAVTSFSCHSVLNRMWSPAGGRCTPKPGRGSSTNSHLGLVQKKAGKPNQTKSQHLRWWDTTTKPIWSIFFCNISKNLPDKLPSLPLEFIFSFS